MNALPLQFLIPPLALFLLLTVVGCTGTISWKGDPPFPDWLLRQLETQEGGRAEVNELLGSPNATRRSGKLAIYIEPRQLEAYAGGVAHVENHHLLIEYDERERVIEHQLVVNSECIPSGECLSNTRCTRGRYCPPARPAVGIASLDDWRTEAIDRLVVYAAPDADEQAKAFDPIPARCQLFVYRSSMRSPANVKVGHGAKLHPIALPPSGFVVWKDAPGQQELRVLWNDAPGEYARHTTKITCHTGSSTFVEIALRKRWFSWFWGWPYATEVRRVGRSTGEAAVRARWLVLE